MMWFTHFFIGLLFTVWIFNLLNIDITLPILALAGIASIFPDLDASESKIKHLRIPLSAKRKSFSVTPFKPIGQALHLLLGHRRSMHSLLMLVLLLIPLGIIYYFYRGSIFLYLAFLTGYFSHLLADGITKKGILFFFPNKKIVRFLPKPIAVKTGSAFEIIVFLASFLGFIYWFVQYKDLGLLF